MKTIRPGWEIATLAQISKSKGEYGSGARKVDFDGDVRYVRITDISEEGGLRDDDIVSPSVVEEKYFLNRHDLLFARSGSVGRTYLHEESEGKYQYAGYLIRFRIRRDKALPKYVYYFTKSPSYLQWIQKMGRNVTLSNINAKEYGGLSVPLASLPVQKQIVAILERAEKLKEKREQANKRTNEILQAVFLDMFGDPINNQKDWNTQKLGDLCQVRRGASPRPIKKYLGGTVPWVKIGDGTKGDDIYINETQEKVTETGASKSVHLKAGSLIFANCGVSLGFARILRIDGCIHDGWLALEDINPQLNKIYLLKLIGRIPIV